MRTNYIQALVMLTGVGLGAATVQDAQAQAKSASSKDVCRPQRNEPNGCFDLRLARKLEEWERWKEAEQEYIQAGRIGAACVRKEAFEALQRLKQHRPKDEDNFEFELGETY